MHVPRGRLACGAGTRWPRQMSLPHARADCEGLGSRPLLVLDSLGAHRKHDTSPAVDADTGSKRFHSRPLLPATSIGTGRSAHACVQRT